VTRQALLAWPSHQQQQQDQQHQHRQQWRPWSETPDLIGEPWDGEGTGAIRIGGEQDSEEEDEEEEAEDDYDDEDDDDDVDDDEYDDDDAVTTTEHEHVDADAFFMIGQGGDENGQGGYRGQAHDRR
jgi:hypothetical protein